MLDEIGSFQFSYNLLETICLDKEFDKLKIVFNGRGKSMKISAKGYNYNPLNPKYIKALEFLADYNHD
jgi:hypothetical protein